MKQKLSTCLVGTVLAVCVGFSGMACFVTGLDLQVNLWSLAFWCFLGGFLCALCCNTRFGLLPLGMLVLALGYLWQSGLLGECLESLLYELTSVYHENFGWKTVRWTGRSGEDIVKTLPLGICLLGTVISMVTGWSIAKGQSAVPAVMIALIPVLLCMQIPDNGAKTLWVAVLFFSVAMLMMGSTVRFENETQGNKLSFYTVIPVALAVALLFALIPQKGYTGQQRAEAWEEKLLKDSFLEEGWKKLTGQDLRRENPAEGIHVELDRLGSRQLADVTMLTVKANYSGTLYLRGSVMDQYDGINWTISDDGTTLPWPEKKMLMPVGEVLMSTRYAHGMLYLPYYVTSMNLTGVGRGLVNKSKLTQYSFACGEVPSQAQMLQRYPDPYTNPHIASPMYMSQAVDLPEDTLKWADPLVREIVGDTVNYYHQAQKIRDYVRSSARYDLNPAMMGKNDSDFVRWFLEDSDSGYCVHFATSAAVLLRAAGIPARYATGYLVQVEEGKTVEVLESDAHAWVEYWLPGFGWTVLEATPPADAEYIPPQTVEEDSGHNGLRLTFIFSPLFWTVFAISLPVMVLTQWQIRRSLRKRKLGKGDANKKMLSRWTQLSQMHRFLQPPEEEYVALAEKARFSQHAVTDEELQQMDMAICEAKAQLRTHNIFRRLWYRVILVLY